MGACVYALAMSIELGMRWWMEGEFDWECLYLLGCSETPPCSSLRRTSERLAATANARLALIDAMTAWSTRAPVTRSRSLRKIGSANTLVPMSAGAGHVPCAGVVDARGCAAAAGGVRRRVGAVAVAAGRL